jgi:threonine/homoserine/homoserine lactone efflux protein
MLGLSAGVSPGPLLTVVITQTIRHNTREGLKIAVAPLMTDLPIILMALTLFHIVPEPNLILGLISFAGALFVGFLGVSSLRQAGVDLDLSVKAPRSYLKGTMVNALSPHPYLFWFSVGVPTIIKASHQSLASALFFVGCFFLCLVGSKMTIALIVGRSREFLSGGIYLWTMRILGICLLLFALLLVKDGLGLIGAL